MAGPVYRNTTDLCPFISTRCSTCQRSARASTTPGAGDVTPAGPAKPDAASAATQRIWGASMVLAYVPPAMTAAPNAGGVVDYFRLPGNAVVELGTRVQI